MLTVLSTIINIIFIYVIYYVRKHIKYNKVKVHNLLLYIFIFLFPIIVGFHNGLQGISIGIIYMIIFIGFETLNIVSGLDEVTFISNNKNHKVYNKIIKFLNHEV